MKRIKIDYLFRSAQYYFSAVCCPNCNGFNSKRIDRKYLVTRLFECQNCHLQFRHPADSKAFNEEFYQSDYEQDDGITSALPSAKMFLKLLSSDFNNARNCFMAMFDQDFKNPYGDELSAKRQQNFCLFLQGFSHFKVGIS